MGRFSNHCNNRFRGAFKHAVNQSIKEYGKNTAEHSQTASGGTIISLLVIVSIGIFIEGNVVLFFGGKNRYLLEDNFLSILFAILSGIIDACIIYFATTKICKKISSKKSTEIIGIIISILLILVMICLIVCSYLPHCYLCNKLLLDDYKTCGNYKLCETCDFKF